MFAVMICVPAVLSVNMLHGDITAEKNSSQFSYRYEANTDEPHVENTDDWTVFGVAPVVNSVSNGILNCTFSQDQMWISTEAVVADLDH